MLSQILKKEGRQGGRDKKNKEEGREGRRTGEKEVLYF